MKEKTGERLRKLEVEVVMGCFWACLGGIGGPVWANGTTLASSVDLSKPNFVLSEIVITGSRLKESAFESPRAVSVSPLKSGKLGENLRTVPDAVRELPGVFVQKTTHGHGAPIVRGFIGRDVLYMVDGIQLNNSA